MKRKPFIEIEGQKIGDGYPCYIVAEVSCNHHQRKQEAFDLVDAAKKAGADAVKLQTYKPETMTIDSDEKWFHVGLSDDPGSWADKTLFNLYKKAYTPWEWQPELAKYAKKVGISLFSTSFDVSAVDFLEKEIDPPAYKVASYELLHVTMLRRIAQTGKPVIVSTGFASLSEVEFSYKTLVDAGAKEIALLHCVTGYTDKPKAEEMNLATIKDLKKRFNVVGGFSYNNHDEGLMFPIAAVKVGASIVEVHLILDRKLGGFDVRFSQEPNELAAMIRRIRKMEQSDTMSLNSVEKRTVGQPHYGPINSSEEQIRDTFRRSIFIVRNVKAGKTITADNVGIIRPAYGISPMYWDKVLGKRVVSDAKRGTPFSWKLTTK